MISQLAQGQNLSTELEERGGGEEGGGCQETQLRKERGREELRDEVKERRKRRDERREAE